MRAFQVMRYGRRTPLINNELDPSYSLISLPKYRSSMLVFPTEQSQHDKLFLHRRHTLCPNMDLSSRRLSFQSYDFPEFTKPQPNLRNFYIFFLILFLFLFLSIVYSFIRMIKNSD